MTIEEITFYINYDSEIEQYIRTDARKYTITEPLPDLTTEYLAKFTQKPPTDFTQYIGEFVYGTPSSGKSWFILEKVWYMLQTYGPDNINIVYSFIDMVETADYIDKEKKVNVLILDDSLMTHSKNTMKKKSSELLSIIRHKYDDYEDKKSGVLYVIFSSQSIYDLDTTVRRMVKTRVYKSLSGLAWDINNHIKPVLGMKGYSRLQQLDHKSEMGDDSSMHMSIIRLGTTTGKILFCKDKETVRQRIKEVKEHATILKPAIDAPYRMSIKSVKNVINIEEWKALTEITMLELQKDKQLLAEAKETIGETTLKRNIEIFYKRYFLGYDDNDTFTEYPTLKNSESVRILSYPPKNFLKKHKHLRARISEEYVKQKLSTELPPWRAVAGSSAAAKALGYHLPDVNLRTSPDVLLLDADDTLLAYVEVKWHFSRDTCHTDPSFAYRQQGQPADVFHKPLYLAVFDARHKPLALRFGNVGDQHTVAVSSVESWASISDVMSFLCDDLVKCGVIEASDLKKIHKNGDKKNDE